MEHWNTNTEDKVKEKQTSTTSTSKPASARHPPLTWQSSWKAALSRPSEDLSKCVLEVATLDFFFLLKSPEPARLGEDTLRWEDLERLERSNMELEMAET